MDEQPSTPAIVDLATERNLLLGESVVAQERIVNPVLDSMRVYLSGSIDSLAKGGGYDLGRAARSMRIKGAMLRFARSPQQETALSTLLAEAKKTSSPPILRQLPSQVFAAQFGLAKTDIDKVVSWMRSQGLDSITVSTWCSSVMFSGHVGTVEAALRTRVHLYRASGREFLANISELSVPAAFAEVITGFGIATPVHRKSGHGKKNRTRGRSV